MPWNESNLMNESIKFVARLLDGESMTAVCREFGIVRKTGYKILNRSILLIISLHKMKIILYMR